MPVDPSSNDAPRTVADLMRRHFIALSPDDSLLDAERTMRLARVRTLPILQEGRLLGIADHRDISRALLRRLVGAGDAHRALATLRVATLAFSAAESVPPDTPLDHAAERLCAVGCGCVAVVESGPEGERLVGLLTESDLLQEALGPGR